MNSNTTRKQRKKKFVCKSQTHKTPRTHNGKMILTNDKRLKGKFPCTIFSFNKHIMNGKINIDLKKFKHDAVGQLQFLNIILMQNIIL